MFIKQNRKKIFIEFMLLKHIYTVINSLCIYMLCMHVYIYFYALEHV